MSNYDLCRCTHCERWVQHCSLTMVVDDSLPERQKRRTLGHTSDCPGIGDKEALDPDTFIRENHRSWGYGICRRAGECGPKVTRQDIERLVYHEMFGGRDATVLNGKWSAVEYTD